MNAMHLQAMDIIPDIPDAMIGDVLDYLSAVKATAERYDNRFERGEDELDLSGLPKSVNADKMTDEELCDVFRRAERELLAGEGIPLKEFDRMFRKKHGI